MIRLSPAQKRHYATIYVLKMLDLKPEDGGQVIPVLLPAELASLEDLLEEMAVAGLIRIDRKKQRYVLAERGVELLGALIDEIEVIIEELDELEAEEVVEILRQRNLDPFRVRFLWGWYDGEFDDVEAYQRRRGFDEIEPWWAAFILSDAFYEDLARDL